MAEGYRGDNGWAIGPDTTTPDPEQQDREDAASLCSLVEEQGADVLRRGPGRRAPQVGRDHEGVDRVLRVAVLGAPMVRDYAEKMYLPLAVARKA